MHGRPRKPNNPQDEGASAHKASKFRAYQSQFLHFHHNKIYDKEAIEVSTKLLENNPEFYTAWNYRKLAVLHILTQLDSDPESLFKEELRVAENALRQNPKSYGAWHHRKWVLSKGHSSVDNELRLLDKYQKADTRNFHAWNYRRFVAALKSIADEDELKYTTEMINRNFSNYSAWHNRSVLLLKLLERKAEGYYPKEKILTEEYHLVHNAIFIEPDDQSGWFYYLWLLKQTITGDCPLIFSSWPACDSEVIISTNKSASGCIVSSLTSYSADHETIPLIIYFNQAVRGVNSSTVAVESAVLESNDINWRPLSADRFGSAQAWVALLKFSDMQCDYSVAYPVEVSMRDSFLINTPSGGSLDNMFLFKFMVRFQQRDLGHDEGHNLDAISWEESNFLSYDRSLGESHLVTSYKELNVDKNEKGVSSKRKVDILTAEIEVFRELLSNEDCKIGKLTLARLLTALDTVISDNNSLTSSQMELTGEVLALYSNLMNMDAPHLQYYKDEQSLIKLRKIACCKESLLRYCWCYSKLINSNNESPTCLRLNSLSLSRIGFIENFLWVQMLDLSHNELRSIEGLEVMQLLSCLNLSNNKIKNFSSLDPLRHLKLLKVLNISHNEIGMHSIDSTRYLCSSPLNHLMRKDWKMFMSPADHDQLTKHWDAFLIFEDLTLIQLEITGNAIVDEDFKSFLLKLLPTLKWLDGKKL